MIWAPLQDTITGFLLAGVGNVDLRKKSNFLIVTESTHPAVSGPHPVTPSPAAMQRWASQRSGKSGVMPAVQRHR